MENQTFTREQLHDLVWSEPLLTLSKKYSISDVGLRKICIRLNIPLPKNGHWQKVQYGKKVTKTPLPPADKQEEITFSIRDKNSNEIVKELSPLKVLQKEIEEQLKNKLDVPEHLTNPDQLIRNSRDKLSGKLKYTDNDYTQRRRESINITVSKEQQSRALKIMDTLVKALKARNHTFKPADFYSDACIKEQMIEISLREKTSRIKKETQNGWGNMYDYKENGLLIIKIDKSYRCKEFIDGKLPLEKQLSLIIASLEILAIKELEWKEECRIRREEEERKKKLRLEFEKRQDEDLKAFRETLNKAERWHKAKNLRNYINEVESKAIACNNLTEETQTWLTWARKKAEWYDPFIESNDELLNEINKETLDTNRKQTYWGNY